MRPITRIMRGYKISLRIRSPSAQARQRVDGDGKPPEKKDELIVGLTKSKQSAKLITHPHGVGIANRTRTLPRPLGIRIQLETCETIKE